MADLFRRRRQRRHCRYRRQHSREASPHPHLEFLSPGVRPIEMACRDGDCHRAAARRA
jgi:hypothetical protein